MTESDAIYATYHAEYAAIVKEGEATITAALSDTPIHRLYLAEALLDYRKALLPTLSDVSTRSYPELSTDFVVNHLRVRVTAEATAILDTVSTRREEAQRFASARFRDAMQVARRR